MLESQIYQNLDGHHDNGGYNFTGIPRSSQLANLVVEGRKGSFQSIVKGQSINKNIGKI